MSTSNEWDSYADGWDDDEAARAYAAAAFESLLPLLDAANLTLDAATVIDFGCGTGLLTERLVGAGAGVDAVDTSTAMLGILRAKIAVGHWTDVRVSTTLPDDPGSADLVVCSSVCGFLDDYPTTVAELVERLRPGGLFVQWDWERTSDEDHGLARAEIDVALVAAGLVGVVVDDAFAVTVGGETMQPIIGYGRRPLNAPLT